MVCILIQSTSGEISELGAASLLLGCGAESWQPPGSVCYVSSCQEIRWRGLGTQTFPFQEPWLMYGGQLGPNLTMRSFKLYCGPFLPLCNGLESFVFFFNSVNKKIGSVITSTPLKWSFSFILQVFLLLCSQPHSDGLIFNPMQTLLPKKARPFISHT